MANYVYGENVSGAFPNVSMSIEQITPDTAAKMLEHNEGNRKLQVRKADSTRAIENDEFVLNGETIIFADDGTLLDGQHRLCACVAYNKPIVSIVVRGIPKDAQITIDTGKRRGVADNLTMRGYNNASIVGSIGRAFLCVEKFGVLSTIRGRHAGEAKATVKEVVSYIDANYEKKIKQFISPVRRVYERFKGIRSSTIAVVFQEIKQVDIESYEHFVGMLTGAYSPDENMIKLICILQENASKRDLSKRLSQEYIAAFMVKTWNAYMKGETIKQLKYSPGGAHPEQFPEIFMGWN